MWFNFQKSAAVTLSVRGIHRGGESDAGVINHRDEEKIASQHRRHSRHSGTRWLHYNVTSKPTPANVRERNIAVTSYYNQTAIDSAIEKVGFQLRLIHSDSFQGLRVSMPDTNCRLHKVPWPAAV